jgi:hypothetical protein
MDFIEGLPTSVGKNLILVVVNRFTKYGHFIVISHPFSATIIKVFFDNIYTSNFWQHLFKLVKVPLCMSSSYHPQTNGQTERVNQCLETFLHCFVHACPVKWMDWLSAVEYWYNISRHFAIGCSPFEALYGYTPKILGITPSDAPVIIEVSD